MRTTPPKAETRSQKLEVRRPKTRGEWPVVRGKHSPLGPCPLPLILLASSFWLLTSVAAAQQLSTQTAPIFAVNAQYVQGVAPGYWPTAGAGLVLNIASGTATCNNAPANYAGGTLTLAANATNYVYLDPSSGCAPAYNTTGFPVGAPPVATVSTSASGIAQISDQRTWFAAGTPPFVSASSFSGASVGAQIDAACASLGGKAGAVLIPYGMGSGQSLAGLANGCALEDLRGSGSNLTTNNAPDAGGTENNYSAPFLFRYRWGAAQPPLPNDLGVVEVFGDYWTGGTNATGSKSNPRAFAAITTSRTPAQVAGSISGYAGCFSQGDCIGVNGTAQNWGTENAGGDEGVVAGRFEADQGNSEFSATVSSVSGNTINYSSAVNEWTRGEQRFIVDTGVSNSKVYSTGTVSTVKSGGSGDITVTGSGVSWSSFGDGLHCFWMTHGADRYGLSIRHVFQIESGTATATAFKISFYIQGVAHGWVDDDTGTADSPAGTGLYNIAPCSTVTSLGLSGSLTVANASLLAAGDSIFMPLGLGTEMASVSGLVSTTLPDVIANTSLGIANISPYLPPATGGRPVYKHLSIAGNASFADIEIGSNSGADRNGATIPPPSYGLHFGGPGNWATPFVALGVGDSSASFPATINLLGVQNAVGQLSLLQYIKQSDRALDTYQLAAGLSVTANTPPATLSTNGASAVTALWVTAATGGNTSGTGTSGGDGGPVQFYGGAGGTSSGGTNVTGGAASAFTFGGAAGGAGTGTGNGGAGSSFNFFLGAGGAGAAAGPNGRFLVRAPTSPNSTVLTVQNSSGADQVYVDSGFNLNAANNLAFKSTGSHLNTSAAGSDLSGTISLSAATTGSHTFAAAFASTPVCVLTPESNPGAATWWVTKSATAVTVNLSLASTITFDYVCVGNPN